MEYHDRSDACFLSLFSYTTAGKRNSHRLMKIISYYDTVFHSTSLHYLMLCFCIANILGCNSKLKSISYISSAPTMISFGMLRTTVCKDKEADNINLSFVTWRKKRLCSLNIESRTDICLVNKCLNIYPHFNHVNDRIALLFTASSFFLNKVTLPQKLKMTLLVSCSIQCNCNP
jgi:hypothetical protein